MKIIVLALIMPMFAYADLEAHCKPATLTIESGDEVHILVYVKNYGEDSIAIPGGDISQDTYIIPQNPILQAAYFSHDSKKFIYGACGFDLVPFPKEYAPHSLHPQDTSVYEIRWSVPQTPPDVEVDLWILHITIDGLDTEIPPLTFLRKEKKSNQNLQPTPLNAGDEEDAQGGAAEI